MFLASIALARDVHPRAVARREALLCLDVLFDKIRYLSTSAVADYVI